MNHRLKKLLHKTAIKRVAIVGALVALAGMGFTLCAVMGIYDLVGETTMGSCAYEGCEAMQQLSRHENINRVGLGLQYTGVAIMGIAAAAGLYLLWQQKKTGKPQSKHKH